MRARKCIRGLVAIGIIYLFTHDGLRAQSGAEISSFLLVLQNQIRNLTSVSCHIELAFNEKAPAVFLDWSENADSFLYTYREYDESGKQFTWFCESSGLTRSMIFHSPGGQVLIRKEPVLSRDMVRNFALPTAIFEFAFDEWPNGPWKSTSIRELQKPDFVEKLRSRINFIGKEIRNKSECLVFEVDGGRGRFDNSPMRYRVFVDNEHEFRIIGWTAFDSKGSIFAEYNVVDFIKSPSGSRAIDNYFPDEVKVIYYESSERDRKSIPKVSLCYKYSNVMLNEFSLHEEITVDLTSAESIYDEANDVLIAVPK